GAIQQGDFATADRVLAPWQFTSLPGGPEQSAIWSNPENHQIYGPNGNAPQGAPISASGFNPCVTASGSVATGPAPEAGEINASIYQAASQMYGFDSSSGPEGGNKACAWAVDHVLAKAGIEPMGTDNVPAVAERMRSGRGARVSLAQAQAGDIILSKGYYHIGICMNNGCSEVLSNSSSTASFRWRSDNQFGGEYDHKPLTHEAPTEEIWRIKR
ncbi:MAG: hypothetical protein HC940_12290, partial [Acaryochloris sp. SU_5_25]|nr:hypothetical protein [Acaryochloris sp. SU_5_25]